MKEKPKTFRVHEVRAILDGSKTQTRWAVKHCTQNSAASRPYFPGGYKQGKFVEPTDCPYGQPGDRLWVRETWLPTDCAAYQFQCKPSEIKPTNAHVYYRADDGKLGGLELHPDYPNGVYEWKPSIFMLRWASRITLEITDVRVERLQDISEEDAMAEGAFFTDYGKNGYGQQLNGWSMTATSSHAECLATARHAFASYINQIHGGKRWNYWYSWPDKYPMPIWEQSPWVWVVSFRKI